MEERAFPPAPANKRPFTLGPTLALGLSQEQNDDDDDVVAPANRDEERKTEPKAVSF